MAVTLCAGTQALAQGEPAEPWPTELYNPKPLPDDVILPMPCQGKMVFRKVVVPAKDLLDDYRIAVGGLARDQAYKENQHADYIAGAFTDAEHPGQRLFYIGKYDVTRLQFASLHTPCPTIADDARMPQTAITWVQAVDFADGLSAWMIAHARTELPSEAGQPGFLRLPSEAEWEFAARGGAKVTVAEFAAPLPPMSGPLERYAWYGGTESSNNELQPVGLLEPNPLGLFDMLGDAGQFASDLFRLNHLSRMQGGAGGYVVRGSSYTTPAAAVRSAAREEFAPYDAQGPRRQNTVGFRLVLVAPVLPTPQRVREVSTAWQKRPDDSGGALPEARPDDPVAEMDALANAVDDKRLKTRLSELSVLLASSIKTRNEQRDRAARNNLNLATWLVAKLVVDTRRLVGRVQVASIKTDKPDTISDALIRADTVELNATISYYRDTLQTMGQEYPAAVRDAQALVLKAELSERGAGQQAALVDTVRADLAAAQRDGAPSAAALVYRFKHALCITPVGRSNYAEACKDYLK